MSAFQWTAFQEDPSEPFPVFSGSGSGGTQYTAIRRRPFSLNSTGEGWEDAIYPGVHIRFASSASYLIAGPSGSEGATVDHIVDRCSEFAFREWNVSNLEYEVLPAYWPRVAGWEDTGTSTILRVVGSADEAGLDQHPREEATRYWAGANFPLEGPTVAAPVLDPKNVVSNASTYDRVLDALDTLFEGYTSESFDYGGLPEFDSQLLSILVAAGDSVFTILGAFLYEVRPFRKEPSLEALAFVGRAETLSASEDRLNFLLGFLTHPLPSMRDAAGLALAELDLEEAIPALRSAIDAESSPQVRANLLDVVTDLQGE